MIKRFNGMDMFWACLATFVACILLTMLVSPDRGFHYESALPSHCNEHQTVLVTTPTPVEYYVCETHWVRR